MPKGGRGKRDYEKEIQDTINRMEKYPEHLKSARHSRSFIEFLENIGVNPASLSTEAGQDFWESVRTQIDDKRKETDRWIVERQEAREVIERRIKATGKRQVIIDTLQRGTVTVERRERTGQIIFRGAKGQFTKNPEK